MKGSRDSSAMDLRKKVCKGFCAYYKPSKNDKLACAGFRIIERLVKGKKNIFPERLPEKPETPFEKILAGDVCSICSFYKNDCDFAAKSSGSLPCGGLKLLGYMLENDKISIDDIKGIIKFRRRK